MKDLEAHIHHIYHIAIWIYKHNVRYAIRGQSRFGLGAVTENKYILFSIRIEKNEQLGSRELTYSHDIWPITLRTHTYGLLLD